MSMFRVVDKFFVAFETDISQPCRDTHPCGILHALRSSHKDEHCFLWVDDLVFIESAMEYLKNEGFHRESVVFIPFSSKNNWVGKYPHAALTVECCKDGQIFHSSTKKNMGQAHRPTTDIKETNAIAACNKKRKRHSNAANMFKEGALLPNAERDELHIEIHKYFQWFLEKLADLETSKSSGRRLIGRAGVDVPGVQRVLNELESTFEVIKHLTTTEEANKQKGAPFLEEALEAELIQLVGQVERNRKPPYFNDFDAMYEKLLLYKQEYGDTNVPHNYKEDPRLGHWVSGTRCKMQKLMKNGIEFEVVKPYTKPKSKTLTKERIEKLESIGFKWKLAGEKLSWNERFNELMEYYHTHGKWPSHSSGSLGEWVHKQRVRYREGDENYMKNLAPKLDEVGFEWAPRAHNRILSWDKGFEMLVEFGREHGYFEVPCPMPESSNEEFRLYKWVEKVHSDYEAFKNGEPSGFLNDERVLQLIKIGFEFKNN